MVSRVGMCLLLGSAAGDAWGAALRQGCSGLEVVRCSALQHHNAACTHQRTCCRAPLTLQAWPAPSRRGVSISVPGNVPAVLVHRYGPDYMVPRYMDKGRDSVEQGKLYARLLSLLGAAGLRA